MTFTITNTGWFEEIRADGRAIGCPKCFQETWFEVEADAVTDTSGIYVRVRTASLQCSCGWSSIGTKPNIYASWAG